MPVVQRFPSLPRVIVAVAATLLVLVMGSALAGAQSSQPVEQGGLQVDDSDLVLVQGQRVGLSGGGFAPGADVDIVIESDPVHLATVDAGGAGTFSASVTIPSSMPPGDHTLRATGADGSGGLRVLTAGVTVTPDPSAFDPSDPSGPGPDGVGGDPDGGTLPRTGAGLTPLAVAGLVAVAVGGALMVVRARRLG